MHSQVNVWLPWDLVSIPRCLQKNSHFLPCALDQVLAEPPGEAAKLQCSRVNAIGWDVSVPSACSLRKVEGAIAVLMSRTGVVFGTNMTIRVVCGRSAGSIPSPTEVL